MMQWLGNCIGLLAGVLGATSMGSRRSPVLLGLIELHEVIRNPNACESYLCDGDLNAMVMRGTQAWKSFTYPLRSIEAVRLLL
jgi:hypothetical protein